MVPFLFWMFINSENVTEETQLDVEKQVEYRTRFSVAFQLLLPVAGLIFVLFRQKNILNRLLVQLDRNCVSVLCPSLSRREKLLKWASDRLPPTWSSSSKTLSGGIVELWSDGSLLCTLINSAVPGACPNPHRHWKKPPTHAQSIAYKYLGVIPLFTEDDLSESLNSNIERPFLHYLNELYKAITKLTEHKTSMKTLCVSYIPRGMGLFSGEQYKKTVFYIYLDEQLNTGDNTTILVHIRGPYGIYGEAVVPKFPQTSSNDSKVNSNLNSPKASKQHSNFIRKFALPFLRYHKQYVGDNMVIDVVMEETRAKITYIPRNCGMYEINMIANGELLKGCPFNVHIFKNTSGVRESFKNVENIPENATYTIRKVTAEKSGSFNNDDVKENSSNLDVKKIKFNFEEVVKEITKNGAVFKDLEEDTKDDEENAENDKIEFGDTNNTISTIEEVEEHTESEIDSSLGFSETISEDPHDNLNTTQMDIEENNNFDSNSTFNQSDLQCDNNHEINDTISSNSKLINLVNGNDVTNTKELSTDIKNKQNATEIYDAQSTSLIDENVVQSHYHDNDSAYAPFMVKEYLTQVNVNKIKIPEIFNASTEDKKYIKNVINISNKNESNLKKYFQLQNWTEDTNNNKVVNEISTEPKENETYNDKNKYINDKKILENSIKNYEQLKFEVSNNKHMFSNNVTRTPHKSITTNKKVYRAVLEFIPTSNAVEIKTEKPIPITQKQFLQEMLDIKQPQVNQYEKHEKIDMDTVNVINIPKTETTTLSTTKLHSVNQYTLQKLYLDKNASDEEKIKHDDDSNKVSVIKNMTKNNYKHKSLYPDSHTALDVVNSIPKPSISTTASPICTDHIVPEVPYSEMSLTEKRSVFSANLSTHIPTSTNSPFSETENAEVFKNQRHLKFEGLSVLNVLGSLKQSQSSSNTENYSLSMTVSLPNISTLDSEYTFPQLVKEKKNFWEEVSSSRASPLNKNQNTVKRDTKNMTIKRVSSFPVSIKHKIRNNSFENNSNKNAWPIINTVSTINSQTNSLNQSLPNISQQSDDIPFHNLVKEKKNFWETLPKSPSPVAEKHSRKIWMKPRTENTEKITVEESTKNSISSSEETPSSLFSYNFDSSLNQSLPNISLQSDNQSLVKQKKNFWELISSRSSSSLSSITSPKKFDESERLRLIWKKPEQDTSQNISRTEKFEIYKSADDILSMTEYYTNQSSKKYKSLDNSLDNCTAVSIEERKKMLLKQNYDKERSERERMVSSKTKLVLRSSERSDKEIENESIKKKSYFSPIVEKIRKFNSVSSLEEKSTKSDAKVEIEKSESSNSKEKTVQSEKPKTKSHFKRAVKYFKNLEAKSLGKTKTKSENSAKFGVEVQHKLKRFRERGGSLNLPNVSNRFFVKNLYKDVFGNNRGSFKGTPNRSALVEALATFSRKDVNKVYPMEEDEDDIKFDIFKKNIKTKKRKSLRSVFDLYY